MYDLPTSVTVRGKEYNIRNRGDYRVILDIFSALQDTELGLEYRIVTALIIFCEEINSIDDLPSDKDVCSDLVTEMFRFINCGQDSNRNKESNTTLIYWEDDSQIICAAVNQVAGTEIRALPYLHWWTFYGYYMSVGQSVLSTVVNIRSKLAKSKKLEKWEKEFRSDNPQYFMHKPTEEERDLEAQIRELWNSGGEDSG